MIVNATYTISDGKREANGTSGAHYIIVSDIDPTGVTMSIRDGSGEPVNSFNLPRQDMIEALEYIVAKLKAK